MSEGRGPFIPQATGGPGVTRFATRGDHRLSYESSGDADGIPVLGLHDLLADRGQLRPLGEALTGTGFRVTLPDARGHGASPMLSGRGYRVEELAADALAILDAEGLDLMHVAAIGWGAATALALVLTAPRRVASLVLADPYVPAMLTEHPDAQLRQAGLEHLEVLQEAASAAEKGLTDRALDLFLGVRIGEGWRDRLSKARLGAIRRSAGNLGPLLNGITPEPFDPEALRSVEAPVTLLLSADAPVFERGMAEVLVSLLSNARVETIPFGDDEPSAQGVAWGPAIARALVADS